MPAENLLESVQILIQQDYYERLGVPRDASESVIAKAYRTLSRKYHPDKNPSAEAGRAFSLLNDAYVTLTDPTRKREYDHLREDGLGNNIPPQAEYKEADTFQYNLGTRRDINIHHSAISNNFVAIVSSNEGIILFNNRTGQHFKTFQNPSNGCQIYYGVMISEMQNTISAVYSSGNVDVFNIATGEIVTTYPKIVGFATGGGVIAVDDKKVLVHDSRQIKILFSNGERGATIYGRSINHVALSANKKSIIAASGEDRAVHIFDFKTGELTRTLPTGFCAYYAEMSPNGKLIACAGNSNTVILYNAKGREERRITVSTDPHEEVHGLNFSPNGKYIAITRLGTKGYSIYSIDENKIVYHSGHIKSYPKDIFFTTNNRLILNATAHVYNMAVPLGLTITLNQIGAPPSEIRVPGLPKPKQALAITAPPLSSSASSSGTPLLANSDIATLEKSDHRTFPTLPLRASKKDTVFNRLKNHHTIDRAALDIIEEAFSIVLNAPATDKAAKKTQRAFENTLAYADKLYDEQATTKANCMISSLNKIATAIISPEPNTHADSSPAENNRVIKNPSHFTSVVRTEMQSSKTALGQNRTPNRAFWMDVLLCFTGVGLFFHAGRSIANKKFVGFVSGRATTSEDKMNSFVAATDEAQKEPNKLRR